MSPCEEKGYFPGMLFEHVSGGVAMLVRDDKTHRPDFVLLVGKHSDHKPGWFFQVEEDVSLLFPAKEYPDLVWVEGIYDIPVQIPKELLSCIDAGNSLALESLSKDRFRLPR